jgi:hypothetical protein
MAHYLVRATPRPELLGELRQRLRAGAFSGLRPFGQALTYSLNNARTEADGRALWEEEDYCSPPLAQERAAVLDLYFDEITVERVDIGEGWARIENLPKLNANR